ncbi:leucine-rich repeat transmembrane protein FLRT2-like [Clavelina lepadiformis]|uniref:leucine-rich repeat transmembrane protein FLRT2-like n=1 Tax=Clavelina lepadiformis TaxID=159417 RepID=UPI004041555C
MHHLLFLLSLFVVAVTAFTESANCPYKCRCDRRRYVYCNQKHLLDIPSGIPVNTEKLLLSENEIKNDRDTDRQLSRLRSLEILDMHKNKLTAIPTGLPNSLTEISLRNNNIKFVGKSSLKGLSSLTNLELDYNNITNQGLTRLAFADTHKLKELVLSYNALTEFPEGLPNSLVVLQLDNNQISHISVAAVERLTNVRILDLSNNKLVQNSVDPGAMVVMSGLRSLYMNFNQLAEIPTGLPSGLTRLELSNNNIEYIYDTENEVHGSLGRLSSLTTLDLRANKLRNVKDMALSSLRLRSAEFHDNPWQCDCHLRYFKQWLSTATRTTVVSSLSEVSCSSPSAFVGVTLMDLDIEALNCASRTSTQDLMSISNIGPHGFFLNWVNHEDTPDPPFINRQLMYGPLKCQNCSFESSEPAHQVANQEIVSHLSSFSFQDMTTAVQFNPRNASVQVGMLQPNTHYAVCVLDSQQDANSLSINHCRDVWTSAIQPTLTPHDIDDSIPLWIVILCCVAVLLVVVGIISAIVWKRRNLLNTKTPPVYSGNREDPLRYPEAYLPGYTRTMNYMVASPQPRGIMYGTNMTDRTYAECGPATSTNQRSIRRDSAVDARMEFEVLLKPNDDTRPKRLHTPMSSYSDSRDDGTLSTNHTVLSGSHDHGSPPPTYDCLHSFECVGHGHATSLPNDVPPPQLNHETGSYV